MWFKEKETGKILSLSKILDYWVFTDYNEIFFKIELPKEIPELTKEEAKFLYLL